MKVTLKNKKANCVAFGLKFDVKGICNADIDSGVADLIKSGVVVEVKAKKKKVD